MISASWSKGDKIHDRKEEGTTPPANQSVEKGEDILPFPDSSEINQQDVIRQQQQQSERWVSMGATRNPHHSTRRQSLTGKQGSGGGDDQSRIARDGKDRGETNQSNSEGGGE